MFDVSLHSGRVLETACQRTIRPGNIMRVLYLVPVLRFFVVVIVSLTFLFFFLSLFVKISEVRCGICYRMRVCWISVHFETPPVNFTDQHSFSELQRLLPLPLPSSSSRAIAPTKNSFTVELLIGFAWDCQADTIFILFRLNQITFGTLRVYHIAPNTLECLQ